MTQVHAVHSAAPIAADAFVLDGHELRDGIDLADTSRFGDDIWQLAPINHQDHLSRNILNFPSLPEQFRAVTKELFMHRLLFRYHRPGIAVSAAHRLAYAGLVLLGVALLGVTVVVFEVVYGRTPATLYW